MGTIVAENRPEGGAVFQFWIPLVPDPTDEQKEETTDG
jgi:hypothetical protein